MDYSTLFPAVVDDGKPETIFIGGKVHAVDDILILPLPAGSALPHGAAWVDGGSAALFSTPSRCVALIKIGVVMTIAKRREKVIVHQYLVSVTRDGDAFIVRNLPLADAQPLAALHQTIIAKEFDDETKPIEVIDAVRVLAEHEFSGTLLVAHPAIVLVRDGSFRSQSAFLRQRVIARNRECAVAKTSFLTTSKNRPLAQAIGLRTMELSDTTWVATIGEVLLAKLHPAAERPFMIEHADDAALTLLHAWSADAAMPGYPYPLVLVDQLARVTNEERDMLRAKLVSDKEFAARVLPELRSADAHDVLEHILYGKNHL